MARLKVSVLATSLRLIAMEASRFRGAGVGSAIAPPENIAAKPSRYTPAPNHAPRGKRRRQWR